MKDTRIKIAHITDIHIGADNTLIRDIDVKGNFKKIVAKVPEDNPDLIVLGGDLAAVYGETEAYEWAKSELDALGIPYLVMAGNHDIVENLNRVFKLEDKMNPGGLYYRYDLKNHPLFFLDTSSADISSKQLDWLLSETRTLEKDALLFTHHPPLISRCNFMDTNHALKNSDEVLVVLNKIQNINFIFCGHYHTEKTLVKDNKTIFITPSTMMQLSQTNFEYEVQSFNPGWRIIEWDGIQLETHVKTVDLI